MQSKILRFYFIRHGRTEWNELGRLQGNGDSPLTEMGIQGAKATALALQTVDFVAAYSSQLQRAYQTAQYILAEKHTLLHKVSGLNEQSFGNWEGQDIEVLKKIPEYQIMANDPENYQALSNAGETYFSLYERSIATLKQIIEQHNSGNILIVSHGHTLRLLLHVLRGGRWQEHRHPQYSQQILNTAISIFEYEQSNDYPKGKFKTICFNDTQHLSHGSF